MLYYIGCQRYGIVAEGYIVERSEFPKSWILQKAQAVSESRHSTDFMTVHGILIR